MLDFHHEAAACLDIRNMALSCERIFVNDFGPKRT